MNPIFRNNGNAKYSIKDLNGWYSANNLSVMDVILTDKRQSAKFSS